MASGGALRARLPDLIASRYRCSGSVASKHRFAPHRIASASPLTAGRRAPWRSCAGPGWAWPSLAMIRAATEWHFG